MKKALKSTIAMFMVMVMVFGAVPLSGFVGLEFPDSKILSSLCGSVSDFFEGLLFKAEAASTDETYRIVLSWSSSPRDLDAHFTGTLSNGSSFHCYYSNQNVYDNSKLVASLDTDDTSSYGPETITVSTSVKNGTYYVYNYSGSGTMTNSAAKVSLYKGNTFIGTYNVPVSSNTGLFWTLFNIKNGKVYLVNTIGSSISGSSGTLVAGTNIDVTETSAGKNDIVITPKGRKLASYSEEIFDTSGEGHWTVSGVSLSIGSTTMENTSSNKNFVVSAGATGTGIMLTKDDYRAYIIPGLVSKSWSSETEGLEIPVKSSRPQYHHTAYMQKDTKDGKPYVSTVFGKESNDISYKELQSSELTLTKDGRYDVIISVANDTSSSCKYYIEQDAEHKLESPTGIFQGVDLFAELESGKKTYAYIKTSDGTVSNFAEILIKIDDEESESSKLLEFCENSTFNLLGSDFLKVTVPSSVPLIGDAEISFNAFQLPAGFECSGDEIKISIGANIFNANTELKLDSPEKYKKWSKECFADWKYITKTTIGQAMDDTGENFDENLGKYKKAKEGFYKHWKGTDKYLKNKSKNWDIDVLGFVELSWVNGGWEVKEALISLEGSFTFSYTCQVVAWVIPAYVYAEAGGSVGGYANGSRVVADNDIPFAWDFSIKLEPIVKAGVGVGVKGVASAGIYGSAKLPITMNFTHNHLTIVLNGEIGVEAQLLIITAKKVIFDGSVDVLDHYWGDSARLVTQSNPITGEEETYLITYEIDDRSYLENTSDWLGNNELYTQSVGTLSEGGMQLTDLQTSIFTNAQPKMITFGDKMLMTWLEDDASRDEYNRMRLVYSIYDGNVWSAPQPVYDDGCNDNFPALATDGTNVYFTWQKVNRTLTEEDCNGIDSIVGTMETYIATHDAATNSISNVKRLTDNGVYDYSQSVSVINGEPVVYWASCVDNKMDSNSNNTLYRSDFDGNISAVKTNLNYILDFDAAYINGTEQVSYSMDSDGDTITTDDINVFTHSDGSVTAFDKGENVVAYTNAFYGNLNGTETLFVSDMKNIYYVKDGEVVSVLENYVNISGNINFVSGEDSNLLIWTQTTENGNEVYSSAYKDDKWSAPIRISNNNVLLSEITADIYNDNLVGTCTATAFEYDEETGTYSYGATNLCSFIVNEMHDISVDSIIIDERDIVKGQATEFTVHVNNNGSETVNSVTFVVSDGLGYTQTVTQEVNVPSGEYVPVTLTYTAPENYTKTTLSISASSDHITDEQTDNNTTTTEIGVPQIIISESEIHEIGDEYIVTAILTNESDVDAENIVVKSILDDENNEAFTTFTVESILARESKTVEFVVAKTELTLTENNAGKMYLSTENEGVKGNKFGVVISPNENVCAHPLTTTDRLEPTCTESGYEIITCEACGEIIIDENFDALDHEWVNNSCTRCESSLFVYSINDDGETVTVNGYNGSDVNLVIPDKFEEKPVTIISDEFFAKVSYLRELYLPTYIETFSLESFSDSMYSLEAINVSEENSSYSSYDGVLYNKDQTELLLYPRGKNVVTIPSSVLTISEYSFRNKYYIETFNYEGTCDEWCKINIKDLNTNPLKVSRYIYFNNIAFDGNVLVPEGTIVFDSETLKNLLCLNITTLYFPQTITSIDLECLDCYNLEAIYVSEDNSVYSSYDGVLYNKDKTELLMYPQDKYFVTIPNSVLTISEYSFRNIYYIETFNYEGTCGEWCNINIEDLDTNPLKFSDAIYFKNELFDGTVSVPEGTINFDSKSLKNLYGLAVSEICIPASVTLIDSAGFVDLNYLESITVSEENSAYSSIDGILYNKEQSELIVVPSKIYMENFFIPDSVTTISEHAFENACNLEKVYFHENVVNVPMDIENDVWYYGLWSSQVIISAESVIKDLLLDYFNTVGVYCTLYASGTCGENATWSFAEGDLVISGSGAIDDYLTATPSLIDAIAQNFEMPEQIPWGEFVDEITSVVVEEGITRIGSGAFYGIYAESGISLPETLTEIGDFAFAQGYCESLTIPNSVNEIGDFAFYMSEIGMLSIGNNVAFSDNTMVMSMIGYIDVSSDNLNLSSASGTYIYSKDGTKLIYRSPFSEEETIVIPDSVTEIGNGAMFFAMSENPIIIPSNVEVIGDAAFLYSVVPEILLSEGLKSIGDFSFVRASISELNIPASVEKMGALLTECFIIVDEDNENYCSIESVVLSKDMESLVYYPIFYPSDIQEIPEGINIKKLEPYSCMLFTDIVYVPKTVEEIAENAFWGSKFEIIVVPDSVTYVSENAFNKTDEFKAACSKGSYFYEYALENGIAVIETGYHVIHYPEKTEYILGEEISVDGMKIVFYDGTTFNDMTDNFVASGYNRNKAGTQTITLSFDGTEFSYDIYVSEYVYSSDHPYDDDVWEYEYSWEYIVSDNIDYVEIEFSDKSSIADGDEIIIDSLQEQYDEEYDSYYYESISETVIESFDDEQRIFAIPADCDCISVRLRTNGDGENDYGFDIVGAKGKMYSLDVYPLTYGRVEVGDTVTLEAKLLNNIISTESVEWHSSNNHLAVVDQTGNVTFKGFGKVTITATDSDGRTGSYTFNVKSSNPSIEIYNYGRSNSVKVDWWKPYSSATMNLGFKAFNCEGVAYYTWKSDNRRVKVDKGLITNTGYFSRSAKITVTAYDFEGNVVTKSSIRVSFYKFNWQKDKLKTQAVVSDDFNLKDLSVDELESQENAMLYDIFYKIFNFMKNIFKNIVSLF